MDRETSGFEVSLVKRKKIFVENKNQGFFSNLMYDATITVIIKTPYAQRYLDQ